MGVISGSTGSAPPLLASNLGVETGQSAIAAATLTETRLNRLGLLNRGRGIRHNEKESE
jgi:hypothetical protein